jgi:hypothetical protein
LPTDGAQQSRIRVTPFIAVLAEMAVLAGSLTPSLLITEIEYLPGVDRNRALHAEDLVERLTQHSLASLALRGALRVFRLERYN